MSVWSMMLNTLTLQGAPQRRCAATGRESAGRPGEAGGGRSALNNNHNIMIINQINNDDNDDNNNNNCNSNSNINNHIDVKLVIV